MTPSTQAGSISGVVDHNAAEKARREAVLSSEKRARELEETIAESQKIQSELSVKVVKLKERVRKLKCIKTVRQARGGEDFYHIWS